MHKDEVDAIDDATEMRELSLPTTGTPMVIAPKRRSKKLDDEFVIHCRIDERRLWRGSAVGE
jgi:predicted transcriptional regulator